MSDRIQRVSLTLLLAACVSLAAAAPATAGTYVEGVVGQPFTLHSLGQGLSIESGEDETLVLDVDAVTDRVRTEAICWVIDHSRLGHIDGAVSFQSFRVHADFSQAVGVSLTVFFDTPVEDVETVWRPAPYTGTDETGAWVFTPPPYSGADMLAYKLRFTLADHSATGTVAIADFAVDWGEWVAPPDDDDGGGKSDKDDGKDDVTNKQPSGVAYMGGSDSGSGSGGGGTGSGSGQGGEGSTGGGSQIDDGGASVDTDAPVAAVPVTSTGDTVTGYPLRVSDLIAGTAGGTDGAGSAGGPVPGDGQSGASWVRLTWLAVPLLFLAPLSAALDRRRVRGRLRSLVESTPDEPAPGATAPA